MFDTLAYVYELSRILSLYDYLRSHVGEKEAPDIVDNPEEGKWETGDDY